MITEESCCNGAAYAFELALTAAISQQAGPAGVSPRAKRC